MVLSKRAVCTSFILVLLGGVGNVLAADSTEEMRCKTYICMMNEDGVNDATCKPLIKDVWDTFEVGTHAVTCEHNSEGTSTSDIKDIPNMTVERRSAGEDYCRPDLRTEEQQEDSDKQENSDNQEDSKKKKKGCKATDAIDFAANSTLYTRQWKMKEGEPITEYYRGTSTPQYEP